jgi:hypothetical protein
MAYLSSGRFSDASHKKYERDDGWVVTLAGKRKLNPMLETARGEMRVFKRLDRVGVV